MKRHSLVQLAFKSACFFFKKTLQFQSSFIFHFKHQQVNDGSFSNKARENFNLVKIFLNVRVRI